MSSCARWGAIGSGAYARRRRYSHCGRASSPSGVLRAPTADSRAVDDWPRIRAWRKTARAKLIGARVAVPTGVRTAWTHNLAERLREILANAPQPISFYWPFKGEPD